MTNQPESSSSAHTDAAADRVHARLAAAIEPLLAPRGPLDIVQSLGKLEEGLISAEDMAEDILVELGDVTLCYCNTTHGSECVGVKPHEAQ